MSKNITNQPVPGTVYNLTSFITGRAKSLDDCAIQPASLPLGQYVSYGDRANERTLGVVVEAVGDAYGQKVIDTVTFSVSKVSRQAIDGLGGWRLEEGIADQEEIDYLVREQPLRQAENERERKAADQQKVVYTQALVEELKEAYPWAKTDNGKQSRHARAAANMRKDLSRSFPGVKFSVRSDYNSIDINWIDGPTTKQVEAITGKYQDGHFDGMTDCHEHDSSAYGKAVSEVLGRVKYVFEHREYSARFLRDRAIEVCFEYGHEAVPMVKDSGSYAYFERDSTPICKGARETVTEAIMQKAYETAAGIYCAREN